MSYPAGKIGWSPWVHLKQFDVCYGVMPKNASSSFYEALRRSYGLPRRKGFQIIEDCEHLRKVAQPCTPKARFIVRHPLDRFESLWRSKCRDHHGSIGGHPIRDMSPDELFAYIQEHDDPHWRSQAPYVMTLDAEPTLVPVEYFAQQFRLDTGFEAWHQNPTTGDCPMSIELMHDVLEHYANDVLVYERAVRIWELKHGQV